MNNELVTYVEAEDTIFVDSASLVGVPLDSRYHSRKEHIQKMAENEWVDYAPSYCRKQIVISIFDMPLRVFVPANTRWVMIEQGKIYVSSDSKSPTLKNGFEDYHKGEWVDYKSFDAWQKNYIGTLKANINSFHLWKVD